MEFLELAGERYSCRKFTEQPVPEAAMAAILKAGSLAPTAVNKQPVRVWRMHSEKAQAAIRACTACHFDAKEFLVVGAREDEAWVRGYDGKNFAQVDAAIVATHMMLEITAQGLGTTWVGSFDAPALKQACPDMENYDLIAIFPIGYPDAQPSERHSQRKEQDAWVTEL